MSHQQICWFLNFPLKILPTLWFCSYAMINVAVDGRNGQQWTAHMILIAYLHAHAHAIIQSMHDARHLLLKRLPATNCAWKHDGCQHHTTSIARCVRAHRLVECIGEARLPLSDEQLGTHVGFLEQQLERPALAVHTAAAAALRTLSHTYLVRSFCAGIRTLSI